MSAVTAPASPMPAEAGPPRISVEEFVARYAGSPGAELIDGVVKESSMPWPKHGKVCMKIGALIFNHAEANDLGHVMSNDSWVRTEPNRVRGGDVLFYSYERLPRGDVPDGLLAVAPDLVVEVKSPSDRWIDLFIKVGEYLQAGVRVVVLLDPETVTASVYRADELQRTLDNGDELTLPDVLPGFAVPVSHLFV